MGHGDQEIVAGTVAMGIVDHLELVEVDEEDGHHLLGRAVPVAGHVPGARRAGPGWEVR